MATYYVNSATGSDANNGSSGAPWASIEYAEAQSTNGDTVYLAGNFAVNTGAIGYWNPSKSIVWRSSAAVTITGASGPHNIRSVGALTGFELRGTSSHPIRIVSSRPADQSMVFFNLASSGLVFEHVFIDIPFGSTSAYAIRSSSTAGRWVSMTLQDVTIKGQPGIVGIALWDAESITCTRLIVRDAQTCFLMQRFRGAIAFTDCDLAGSGTGLSVGVCQAAGSSLAIAGSRMLTTGASAYALLSPVQADGYAPSVSVSDSFFASAYRGVEFRGGIDGLTLANITIRAVNMALAVSSDSDAWGGPALTDFDVSNVVAVSQSGHAALFGRVASEGSVGSCIFDSGSDIGLVIKCANSTFDRVDVRSGGSSALRPKGSVDCTVSNSRISATGANTVAVIADGDDISHPNLNTAITRCDLSASGASGRVFNLANAATVAGQDHNAYRVTGGATWGTLAGDNLNSLAGLRSALGYDANSQEVDYPAGSVTAPAAVDVRSGTSYDHGDRTGMLAVPASADVRSGVAVDNTTGTCAVPTADRVSVGVRVDDTVGTAVLTAADVQAVVGLPESGDTPVDHNTGGINALRILHGSVGVDDVIIVAYLKEDFEAGLRVRRGRATTDGTGRWIAPMMLDPGVYILIAEKPGVLRPAMREVVVE